MIKKNKHSMANKNLSRTVSIGCQKVHLRNFKAQRILLHYLHYVKEDLSEILTF